MEIAAFPSDEAERLAALRGYAVLDTPPEPDFDELTRFASALCDTPIALVSLVDTGRLWFKSRVGIDVPEVHRNIAFCSHAILQRGIFEVEDAALDSRFADNPLVAAEPHIRFYAGAPLLHPGGQQIGTLCVIDRVPRRLTELQRQGLAVLSHQVIGQLELRRQVHQLVRRSVELAEARDHALAGTRAKDVFLASMSHELRTPLNAILGLSQLLLERDDLPSEDANDIQTIDRSGRHLLAVIEDILGYAQLELDRPQLRPRAFDLGELLLEVEAAVRLQLRGRPVTLRIGPNPPLPIVADPTRVRQIVYNLVANALKFTRSGSIELEVEVAGDDYLLHVRDTGIGIAADKLALLFHDFAQVHTEDDGEYGGAGLGLAISRRFARLMGGELTAESERGRGSRFTLRIPTAPADQPQSTIVTL